VLLTIGNGVSVLVIIVINHFNYILISAKVKLKKYMLNPNLLLYTSQELRLKNGLKLVVYLRKPLLILKLARGLNICLRPAKPRM